MKKTIKAGILALCFVAGSAALYAQSTDSAPSGPTTAPGSTIPAVASTTTTTMQPSAVTAPASANPVLPSTMGSSDSGYSAVHSTDISLLESALAEIARLRRVGWPDEAKPWENYDDFMKRLAAEEVEAIAKLERKIFTIGAPQVKLTVGSFDRNLKYWPITVESPDPNFLFKSSFRYSIAGASDIGATYTAFDSLVKTNSLAGEADYSVIRKGSGTYLVEIKAVKIVHKATGRLLARDEGAKTSFMFYTRDPGVRLADGLSSLKTARDTWQIVTVEGGSFQMGALGGEDDQKPVHQVTLPSFLIGKFEVTVGEFRAFVESTGYRTQAELSGGGYVWTGREWKRDKNVTWMNPGFVQTERDPVTVVSWNDTAEYCNWLSWKEGLQPAYRALADSYYVDWTRNGYRLPTEAQWEYAARGGRGSRGSAYAGSVDVRLAAWYYGNSDNRTHAIGTKNPNELGLYDFSGNAWEWCLDWYGAYPTGAQTDPRGPESGTHRVLRGGSYASDEAACKPTYRGAFGPSLALNYSGFRVARPIM